MSVRRGPAIVLSLALSAAALAFAPSAQASDGGAAKGSFAGSSAVTSQRQDDPPAAKKKDCDGSSEVKLRVTLRDNARLETVSTVWSDDDDVWSWKLRHEGDLSDEGFVKAKDADKSFRIVRTMIDFGGPEVTDNITFRAQNEETGEVCKVSVAF